MRNYSSFVVVRMLYYILMAAIVARSAASTMSFRHRVLCEVVGSGPNGETTPESRFFTLQEHPKALTLSRDAEESGVNLVTRTDVDIGPGGLAFYIDNVVSDEEAETLVALTESMGYSRFAPSIRTPAGMRQNKACHWFAPKDTVEHFLDPMFARIQDLLPASVDAGDRLYLGLSHRLAHYKYDTGDVFNMHTDGAWPGQSVNSAGDGIEEWDVGAESKLSMLLYLSDEDPAGGGQTRLYRFDGGVPVDVAPKKGRALFFRHGFGPQSVPHAGLRLLGEQPKYVCRLNVLYQQDNVM